jgi:hypothetical protein
MVTLFLLRSTRSGDILGWLVTVGLATRTEYQFPLLWVFFDIFLLLLDNDVELCLQIFEPFPVRI